MRRALILPLIALLVWLPGCASKYGDQITDAQYYPQCYRPIQDLRDNEHNVAKNTGAGALLGAFSGAIIGLIATGKWQGAVMGGAIGGAGGAVAGNIYATKQQENNDNIRLASYSQDIDENISHLDVTSAAARTALDCYDRQFRALLAEIKSGAVTRPVAAKRFAEIQTGREEAIRILGHASDYGQNLNVQYENAFAEEARNIQAASATRPRAAVQRNAQALDTARRHKQNLTRKTTAINRQKETAISESQRQTQELNAAYAALNDIKS